MHCCDGKEHADSMDPADRDPPSSSQVTLNSTHACMAQLDFKVHDYRGLSAANDKSGWLPANFPSACMHLGQLRAILIHHGQLIGHDNGL